MVGAPHVGFNGWVLGFYGEWSKTLATIPTTLADAQVTRWQSKYGLDPADQQRAWLVNKVRTGPHSHEGDQDRRAGPARKMQEKSLPLNHLNWSHRSLLQSTQALASSSVSKQVY